MSIAPISPPVSNPVAPTSADARRLHDQCRALESAFLSEMLSHAGVTSLGGAFGGGEGEAQFHSFLRQALADRMVERGGIGLAERMFEAMKGRLDDV